jgi:hypothetical protein
VDHASSRSPRLVGAASRHAQTDQLTSTACTPVHGMGSPCARSVAVALYLLLEGREIISSAFYMLHVVLRPVSKQKLVYEN